MKKAFSIIEIIFVITIVSIISIVAIPKLFYNVSNANIVKLRADVALIREKINSFQNQQTLANTNDTLDDLEDGIMPILSNDNQTGEWSKITTNQYTAWITKDIGVKFVYEPSTLKFDCDFTQLYCKDLTQ